MAPSNGARKAPAPASQNARRGLLDFSAFDKIFSDSERKPTKYRVRRPIPSQSVPGNWSDSKVETLANDKNKPNGDSLPPTTSPIINPIDPTIAAAFPASRPMEDFSETVQCKHCKKPVLKIAASAHIKDCLRKKQEKIQKKKEAKDAAMRKGRNGGVSPDLDDEDGERKTLTGRKSTTIGDDGIDLSKTGKKRKAGEDDGDLTGAKKKKKDEIKAKAGGKPKGPVDVEKQCGVPLPNGQMCARSLTCKSHSMGAKRSVPGRSLPYDMLLAQYQKKNQAKQQRAAIDASAAMADDMLEPPGTIDSDEERDLIMASFNRAFRQNPYTGNRIGLFPTASTSTLSGPSSSTLFTSTPPTCYQPLLPAATKYRAIRIKEMLGHALGGVKGGNLFATPQSLAAQQQRAFEMQSGGAGPMSAHPGSDEVMGGMGDGSRRGSMARPGGAGSRKQSMSGIAV